VTLVFTFVIRRARVPAWPLGRAGPPGAMRRGRRLAVRAAALARGRCLVVIGPACFEWLYHRRRACELRAGGEAINWLGEPALRRSRAESWPTSGARCLARAPCYARVSPSPCEITRPRASTRGRHGHRHRAPPRTRPARRATLDALRAFDLMFVLTGGGPATRTETLTVYAYRSIFQTLPAGVRRRHRRRRRALDHAGSLGVPARDGERGGDRVERPRRARATRSCWPRWPVWAGRSSGRRDRRSSPDARACLAVERLLARRRRLVH